MKPVNDFGPMHLLRACGVCFSSPPRPVSAVCCADLNRTLKIRWLTSLVLPLVLLCGPTCPAQPDDADQAVDGTGNGVRSNEKQAPRKNLLRLNGEDIPIGVLGIDAADLRDELLHRVQIQKNVPGFEVSEMQVEGTVTGELAELQLTLRVVVNRDPEWVLVPVGFPEWQVREFDATFEREVRDSDDADNTDAVPSDADGGEVRAVFGGNQAEQRSWFLRGRGEHVLRMELLGEVRPAQGGRQRLQLSVPPAVISHLQVSFDQAIDDVKGNAERRARVTKNGTHVELWGLSEQTEITWISAAPAESESVVIQAPQPAVMLLDLTTSPASLTCTQPLNISGGTVDQLTVLMPPGFGELAVKGTDENGDSIVLSGDYSTSESGLTAVIRFTEPVRGRISLAYQLGMTSTEFPQSITVSVPDVEGVSTESAGVEIQRPPGLGLESTPLNFARRKRVESHTDARVVATSWDLVSPDSQLQLTISENPAYFAVEPELDIATEGPNLMLQARFPVKVIHGSLNGLSLRWPGFQAAGWQIVAGSIDLTQGDVTTPLHADTARPESGSSDVISMTFPDRESDEFVVEFEARRSLDALEAADGQFTLPDVDASTSHPTTVSLIESDTYSLTLEESGGISRINRPALGSPAGSDAPSSVKSWLVDQSGSTVRVRLTPQTPEIRSTVVVAIENERDSLHVREEIDVDVRHRDLTELSFLIPDSVISTVRLAGRDESLVQSALGGRTTCALPDAMRGRIHVVVDYLWNPPLNAGDRVLLPLALPIDGLESITVGTNHPQGVLVVPDSSLQPVFSPDFVAAWRTEEPLQHIPVRITTGLLGAHSAVPVISLVQVVVGATGVTSTTTAVFDQHPGDVLFQVPASSGLIAAAVNGQPVTEVSAGPPESANVWRVRVPVNDDNSACRVSVTARSPRDPHHHLLSQVDVEAPQVVGTPEWLTTVWLAKSGQGADLFRLGSSAMTLISNSFWSQWRDNRVGAEQALDLLLSGRPEAVRSLVLREFPDALVRQGSGTIGFTTGSRGSVQLMEYSRSAGWLISAAIGIFGFLILVRLRTWGRTAAGFFVAVSLLAWGLLPDFSLSLSNLVLPGILAALAAYGIQQVLGPIQRRRPRRRQQSIFHNRPRSVARSGQSSPSTASTIPAGGTAAP